MSMDDIWNAFEEGKKEEPKPMIEEKPKEEIQKTESVETKEREVADFPLSPQKQEERKDVVDFPLPKKEEEIKPSDFDFSEAPLSKKKTYMISGDKGDGKTTLAFSFPGKICCISFDYMSADVKDGMFNNDPRIHVFDGLRYLSKRVAESWLKSADKSFEYLNLLLTNIIKPLEPDWIVLDGLEIFVRDICEMRMRYRNNLQPFQPFELKLWAERNMYVDQIHLLCMLFAKQGIVYTAYVNEVAVKFEGGKMIEFKRVPKWAADVEFQTQVVIMIDSEQAEKGRKYIATVTSSKSKDIRTGIKIDVTNGGMDNLFKVSKQ